MKVGYHEGRKGDVVETLAGSVRLALKYLRDCRALISPAPVALLLLRSPLDSIGTVLARLIGAGVFALGLA